MRRIAMEDRVLEILASFCEEDAVKEDLNIDLFETGLLDSLAFIEMMIELEDAFGITITPSELDREQINTPQKILDLVAKRVEG